jgi:glyoxylase-like metal-dependent hydrolase (beta-lactamase superfamily II)
VRALVRPRTHERRHAIIYFPDLKVIHTGDLFLASGAARAGARARFPGFEPVRRLVAGRQLDGMDEDARWRALSLDVDAVIPGHGPVAMKADVQAFRNGVAAMQMRLRDLVRRHQPRGFREDDRDGYGWRRAAAR